MTHLGGALNSGHHPTTTKWKIIKNNMVQLDDLVAATGSCNTQRGEHSDGFFAVRI